MIDSLRPERNRKADEQDRFDQDDGEFEVSRDPALHAFMIGDRMAALPETEQNINEKCGPSDKERAHEPMGELDDVIDLVAVLRSVRRHADELVEKSEPIHTASNLRPSVPDAARAAYWRAAKGAN